MSTLNKPLNKKNGNLRGVKSLIKINGEWETLQPQGWPVVDIDDENRVGFNINVQDYEDNISYEVTISRSALIRMIESIDARFGVSAF